MKRWIAAGLLACALAVVGAELNAIISCDSLPEWLQEWTGCTPAGGGGSGAGD